MRDLYILPSLPETDSIRLYHACQETKIWDLYILPSLPETDSIRLYHDNNPPILLLYHHSPRTWNRDVMDTSGLTGKSVLMLDGYLKYTGVLCIQCSHTIDQ